MLICGLDIETTGFDPKTEHVTEVAWVIKDHEDEKPLVMKTHFVLPPEQLWNGAEYIKPTITQLTRIEMRHVMAGLPLAAVLTELAKDLGAHGVEVVCAHNGEMFDRPFLQVKAQELGVDAARLLTEPLWLDTSVDVVYPEHCRYTNLMYVAAFHGLLNPFAHAALFDVMTMLKVLDQYPLAPVLERAKSPWCYVAANVGYDNRQAAKDRRYNWENVGTKAFPKTWVKRIKEMDLEKERAAAPFQVTKLNA